MKSKLKIAQLVLPWMSLPPKGYAGTERIVYSITEGLVKKGHDVTLFSTADSSTSAKLVSIFDQALGLQTQVMNTLKTSFYPLMHVAHCFEQQNQFDIIHSHAQFLALPFAAISKTPSLHTFHRTFDSLLKDENDIVKKYSWLNFISLSHSQRIENINYVANIYNGIDIIKYKPNQNPKRNYLLWVGRFIDKKGPIEAIQTAKILKIPLILAGKITDEIFFNENIKSEIHENLISYVEEPSDEKIIDLYQNAYLTLAPIKWNEPFGLVPVESMACGTPVVAYANGALRETVLDGQTGFLIPESEGVNGLVQKANIILHMSSNEYNQFSNNCRQHIEKNFTAERMVDEYEKLYEKIIENKAT